MTDARPKRGRRRHWVGFKPYGIGEQKPNHYQEIVRTIWANRHNLRYAWRILRRGVCDGCALGVAGFHDWTIKGVHLCTTRLDLLRYNTMGALEPGRLADVDAVRRASSRELRDLGRLAHPMVRRRGDPGFSVVTWEEALDLVAGRIRGTDPSRVALYLTARGLTNEVYYAAQKALRFIGTPHIDNAARVCHAPSTTTLKSAIGVGATTVSYRDIIEDTDLVVLFGSNVANAQPVFMKYLFLARKRGVHVAVVNPLREPGLERYWVPSNVESALFGTHMADEFFTVHTGGDVAFLNGVLKVLLRDGGIDRAFVCDHTTGFDELLAELERESFDDLEQRSGASRDDMVRFARMYQDAKSAVLVWSMGITQHKSGSDNVSAIVNLALARGNIGRAGAGLMPIRGHSGVQGGAEMGAYANVLPGGVPVTADACAGLSDTYGFEVPSGPALTAGEMLDAAQRGELDVLWSSGGNFLEVLPDPQSIERALSEVPVRVHQDIVVSSQMLVDPGELVVLLPAATRYEQRGGGTETTTERRIAFSPEIPGPRPGEVRSEWEIFTEVAARVYPDHAELVRFDDGQAIRDEIARVVPAYAGIETLRTTGDAVQWGGPRLCEGAQFPTSDGRAHFAVVVPPEPLGHDGRLVLSTRRGKQFNTMVHRDIDPLTGAARDALFMAETDAEQRGLEGGARVLVRSRHGEMHAHVYVAPIRAGNVQVFYPEGNVLVPTGKRDQASGVPDYNTTVEVLPLTEVSIGR
ncbi:MAG: FdhF/YdeP family oxidoreductase [Acidimicrobiia bacterium]